MPGQRSVTVPVIWTLIAAVLVAMVGCHKPFTLPPDNPAYFEKVFHQLDSLHMPAEQSFRYVDSVYAHFRMPGIHDRIRRYDYKGQYYFYQAHDLSGAMRYVDSCLSLLSTPEIQRHYPRQYAKCLIDKAETYQFENNYTNAFFFYRKGLEAIQDFSDSCTMAEYTQRIAMATYRAGRYSEARNLFELALRQFGVCKSDFRDFAYQQCNLDNIGECYAAMGRWDSAAYFYDSTLSFIARAGEPFLSDSSHRGYIETARAVVYGNQGDYYLYQRHDTSKAWRLYQNSVVINMRPLHDSANALAVLVKSAKLLLSEGKLGAARRELDQARATLDRKHDTETDLAWRKLHAEWLARSGDGTAAWQAVNILNGMKDSLRAIAASRATVDVPSALLHIEDKYTIEQLQQRDHLKNVYLWLAVPFVVLMVIIVFLILRGARKSRGHIRQLNRLNKALHTENRQTQTAINALNEDQAMYLRSLKTIAHDLRNPVGAISSAVSLLQKQSGGDEKMKPMLGLIRQAADQSLQLVGGIMSLDLPMGSLKMGMIDLGKLLETCVATLQFKAGEKKQTIRLEAEDVSLLADHDKLWRVIINLLDNAIKFSPEGENIMIKLQRQNDKAVISVSDKGIGIPKGIEQKLFSIDAAAKRTGTAGEASFGLGLAIVSQIVKAHGGTISVQSEEHEGTTFRIELQASAA